MNQKRSGFTIIEIALVLCIAGLIFGMAFIALPSLWTSQRNSDRKAKVMEFINDLKTYQTNNSRGALPTPSVPSTAVSFDKGGARSASDPTSWQGFVRDYVLSNGGFVDPSGEEYRYYIVKCMNSSNGEIVIGSGDQGCMNFNLSSVNKNSADLNASDNLDYTIYVAIGATCDGDRMVKTTSPRSVAAIQILERSERYCYNT